MIEVTPVRVVFGAIAIALLAIIAAELSELKRYIRMERM